MVNNHPKKQPIGKPYFLRFNTNQIPGTMGYRKAAGIVMNMVSVKIPRNSNGVTSKDVMPIKWKVSFLFSDTSDNGIDVRETDLSFLA